MAATTLQVLRVFSTLVNLTLMLMLCMSHVSLVLLWLETRISRLNLCSQHDLSILFCHFDVFWDYLRILVAVSFQFEWLHKAPSF